MTSLIASLSIFEETSIQALRQKSLKLTAYLQYLLLKDISADSKTDGAFQIITPLDPAQRGAQLCLLLREGLVDEVQARLDEAGVIVDVRRPGVIRVAPVPLYNSYSDCWRFAQIFREAVSKK